MTSRILCYICQKKVQKNKTGLCQKCKKSENKKGKRIAGTRICIFCKNNFSYKDGLNNKFCGIQCIIDKFIKKDKNLCWIWSGRVMPNSGIPVIAAYGKTNVYVHRLIYKFIRGSLPDNKAVCHRCDTTGCCNPDHLFLEDRKDVHKRFERSRIKYGIQKRGLKHPYVKISDLHIRKIIELHEMGMTDIEISYLFNKRHESSFKNLNIEFYKNNLIPSGLYDLHDIENQILNEVNG